MSEAAFEELVEGVEKFVVEELARHRHSFETFKSHVELKLKEMEEKMESNARISESKLQEVQNNQRQIEFRIDQAVQESEEIAKSIVERAIHAALGSLGQGSTPFPTSSPIPRDSLRPGCSRMVMAPSPVPSSFQDFDMDKMDDDTKQKLQPYAQQPSGSDKLSIWQRAFFKYFMANNSVDRLGEALICRMIREGEAMRVWPKDFTPDGVPDFGTYLRERIRNERKYTRRAALKRDQRKRLSAYLDDSMKALCGNREQVDEEEAQDELQEKDQENVDMSS